MVKFIRKGKQAERKEGKGEMEKGDLFHRKWFLWEDWACHYVNHIQHVGLMKALKPTCMLSQFWNCRRTLSSFYVDSGDLTQVFCLQS